MRRIKIQRNKLHKHYVWFAKKSCFTALCCEHLTFVSVLLRYSFKIKDCVIRTRCHGSFRHDETNNIFITFCDCVSLMPKNTFGVLRFPSDYLRTYYYEWYVTALVFFYEIQSLLCYSIDSVWPVIRYSTEIAFENNITISIIVVLSVEYYLNK